MQLLSLITFLPAVGVLGLLIIPRPRQDLIRGAALGISVLTFLLSLKLYTGFQLGVGEMQFVEEAAWIPSLGIRYKMGIDGISLFLVLLTTFLTSIAILASSGVVHRMKEYMVAILLLETGMIGVFVALDLVLFYVFWEATLLPMYFIIGIWGGPRRVYATIKFVLFTMAGSLLMLVAIIAVALVHVRAGGDPTFDLTVLMNTEIPPAIQSWLFVAFALAFAIKVPLFPFHTWLPDAHVEAPTAGSVLLAGVLLKMGTYGFLRFALPMFPQATATFLPWISGLALVGIIYGAWVAMVQPDLKSLVAYSSVSHLGLVVLGIFALNKEGIAGSVLQMVNHGLSTGALFLLVGMIYERRHTRMIADFGGLFRGIPLFGGALLLVTLSSIGLPGLNGFVGEFLILLGIFRVHPVYAIVAVTGIVWAAWYMLAMLRRVLFGPIVHPENANLADLTWNERIVLIPILFLIVWIGVYPAPFLRRMEASVERVIVQVERRQMVHSSGFIVQGRLATNYEASTMKPSPVHGSEFIVQGKRTMAAESLAMGHEPSTRGLKPLSMNPEPITMNPEVSFMNHEPSTINPSSVHGSEFIVHGEAALSPESLAMNYEPLTLNRGRR
ncbi:MAG: NADH-quinone oxidoreductase subunit M [candidate division NC10 bacterium]